MMPIDPDGTYQAALAWRAGGIREFLLAAAICVGAALAGWLASKLCDRFMNRRPGRFLP